jgi:hypothetical protein
MAVANGFGKVVTSGSVFMYDTGDTVNSYIGEPTTNLAGTNAARTIGFHNQGAYGNAGSISDAPEKGPGWKKITVNNRGNNFRIAQFPYTSLTAGITYSYSLEIDMGTTSGYYWRIDGSGGYGAITIQNNKVVTTITPSAGVYAIFLNHNTTGVSGISEVIYYRYYQVEQNSHATQFTEGTRSSTQGLLPIVGNSTIDLSNVSFDSNAQKIFDGTDDSLIISDGITSGYERSIEYIVKFYTISGTHVPIAAYTYGTSTPAGRVWLGLENVSGYKFRWHGWGTDDPYSSTTATTGQYYHIVHTYNYNTRKMALYVNGSDQAHDIYDNQSGFSAWSNTSLFSWHLGYDPNAYGGVSRSNIELPIFKTYNREISAAEVRQNYNKYKSRFNLS